MVPVSFLPHRTITSLSDDEDKEPVSFNRHAQTLNTGPADGSHAQTVSNHIMPPLANVRFLILLPHLPTRIEEDPFIPSPYLERRELFSHLFIIPLNKIQGKLFDST